MKIYRHADRAMKKLNDLMSREFQTLSVRLRFDELNVADVKEKVGGVYTRIVREVRREYRMIAKEAKKDAEKEIDTLPRDIAIAAFVAGMMSGYERTTGYVWNHEWTRKRDRLVESLMASGNRLEMREALRRALNLMSWQVSQGADDLTDDTRTAVFNLAGVEQVMWNTQEDEKVCEECQERNHQIFPLDHLPPKHRRCRCYLTAVRITPAG